MALGRFAKGIGKKHHWKYKGRWSETKISPKKWKIDFRATKGKRGDHRRGYPIGGTIAWKIRGTQYAVKRPDGTYDTHLIGTKTMKRYRVPRRGRTFRKRFKRRRRY